MKKRLWLTNFNHKKKRLFFVASVLIVSLLSLLFVVKNFRENIVFFYSPSELTEALTSKKITNRQIRVGGLVKENSVIKIDALTTDFVITDLKKDLKIHYVGMLPDLFRDKQGVVAKGFLDVEKFEFSSRELLIKHDENYMPPEIDHSLIRAMKIKPAN